jgi:hypothetical protein
METIKIDIINPDAVAILEGMELAGLIKLPGKETGNKNLAKRLRGSIPASRAKGMIETIEKERAEWDRRY